MYLCIYFLPKNIVLLFSGHFQTSLIGHIFKVWDNPSLIFQRWSLIFVSTYIIYQFFKVSRVRFFNRNLVLKVAFSLCYFTQKSYIGHIFSVSLQLRWGMFFFHINILGIPWIWHMQKFFFRVHRADFSNRNHLWPP